MLHLKKKKKFIILYDHIIDTNNHTTTAINRSAFGLWRCIDTMLTLATVG